MLSIIVASDRDKFYNKLKINIDRTVDYEYEIVRIKEVRQGLSSAYNNGAKKSKYSILCFVHDDVLFHTKAWGEKIIRHLDDSDTGVIGVMGGRYKSAFGLGWRDGEISFYRYSVKDGMNKGKHLFRHNDVEIKHPVICLDGAFLSCKKEVWQEFRFDEETFQGFHFYDIDFSFRVAQKYKNYTVSDILLEHFSQGKTGIDYLAASLLFDKKHRTLLPYTLEYLSKKELGQLEGYSLSEKLALLKKHRFSFAVRFNLLLKYMRRYFNFYQLLRNVYFGFIK